MNDIAKTSTVALEAISVHVPRYAISHQTFAEATGHDPAKFTSGLGCSKMAVCHPTEDVVTMAAEAGETLMERWKVSPDEVGMLIVATESGVDWAKPIAVYIHQMLGIAPNCRIFDVQHACFGASAALATSVAWIRSGLNGGKKALVIATDIARYDMGSPGEPTQGAGAVAMLVGGGSDGVLFPDFGYQAIYARNVMDFWRPGFCSAAVVNGKYSVECYLRALGETYTHFRHSGGESYRELRYILFHLPFPRMSWKALVAIAEAEARLGGGGASEDELAAVYEEKIQPGTVGAKEIGNIYCGSLFMSLASLLETEKDCAAGEKAGFFSYGSGSCSEFFTGTIGARREIWEGKINLMAGIARRDLIDYETYLQFRKHTSALGENDSFRIGLVPMGENLPPDARHLFLGYRNMRRIYVPGPASRVCTVSKVRTDALPPA
jgi:hydroxymethylglutaryl-CoA synthase